MDNIITYTSSLLEEIENCHDRFMTGEKPEKNRDFFLYVKREADIVFSILDDWMEESRDLIAKGKLKVLHPQQIDATKENMESLVLHSYYKDTRKRRFIEIYKSCYYIFAQVLKETTS